MWRSGHHCRGRAISRTCFSTVMPPNARASRNASRASAAMTAVGKVSQPTNRPASTCDLFGQCLPTDRLGFECVVDLLDQFRGVGDRLLALDQFFERPGDVQGATEVTILGVSGKEVERAFEFEPQDQQLDRHDSGQFRERLRRVGPRCAAPPGVAVSTGGGTSTGGMRAIDEWRCRARRFVRRRRRPEPLAPRRSGLGDGLGTRGGGLAGHRGLKAGAVDDSRGGENLIGPDHHPKGPLISPLVGVMLERLLVVRIANLAQRGARRDPEDRIRVELKRVSHEGTTPRLGDKPDEFKTPMDRKSGTERGKGETNPTRRLDQRRRNPGALRA